MPKPSVFGVPTTVLSNYGGVLIDAVLSRATRRKNTLTKNPIESGAQVSDHKVAQPIEFELEGRLSDTPFAFNRVIVAGPRPRVTNFGSALIPAPGAAQAAFDALVDLSDGDDFFQIVHGNKFFDNCQFAELVELGEPGDGYSIHFSAVIEQVLIVDSVTGLVATGANADESLNNGIGAAVALGFQAVLAVSNALLLPDVGAN